jgi:hypothetical protein
LNHPFLKKESEKVIESTPLANYGMALRDRPSPVMVERQNYSIECDSPLMTTKNQARKQGRLRDDSCLKFKMK